MRHLLLIGSAVSALALAGSCSDDETSPAGDGGAAEGGAGGSGGSLEVPDESCVRPGDKGNDNGVGEFCTPGGDECDGFSLAPACLATLGQEQWFCTRIGCDETTDCGADAGCQLEGAGSACVPCRCSPEAVGCSGSGGSGGGGTGGGGTGGAGGS